jgi:hypothetical protein
MSKPDDIPQDVWETADACFEQGTVLGQRAQVTIARAILAERERCAAIIDAECARVLGRQNGRDHAVDANLRLIAVLLPDLADAIRGGALKSEPSSLAPIEHRGEVR